jgi:lysozyme
MKISTRGLDLIKSFEGFKEKLGEDKVKSYRCPAGVWTIGWGSTLYPNGQKVGPNDIISIQRAEEIFKWHVNLFERDVDFLVNSLINQNQFDALVSFAYNVGSDIDQDLLAEGLGDSTLLKKVNNNPNDPTIATEFMKWTKAGGVVLQGLVKRRYVESKLYFEK